MKIVFLDAGTMFSPSNLHILNTIGEVVLYHHSTPQQTIDRLSGAEIAITNKVVLDKHVLAQCPDLKLICVAATGTNNIDKEYAQTKNIVVKNVTDYSTQSVAQVTFAMLLHLINHVAYYDEYVKTGEYIKNEFFTHVARPYWQLSGKNLGVIGLGTIGNQVAHIASAFGMNIYYYSITGKNNHPTYSRKELSELFKISDVVSIHCPLSEKTKKLVDYSLLKQMKPNAILLNLSRGGVVVEKDLVKALNENLLAGAGIDVFEQEPILPDNPFLKIENKEKIVLSPHVAWASIEARELLVSKLYKNIQEFLT